MAIVREVIHELDPHLRHRVTSLRRRISDESVRRTRRLSTSRLVRILIPEVAAAAGTLPPREVLLREEWNREFFWVDLRQLASLLDFARAELYRRPPFYPKRAPNPARASSSFFLSSSAGFSSFFLPSADGAAGAAAGAIIIELADFSASSMFTSDKAATSALTCDSSAFPPAADTIFFTFSSFTGCAQEWSSNAA